eukprot:scaffold945_cov382-Pavlova_lutheri.AAC.4
MARRSLAWTRSGGGGGGKHTTDEGTPQPGIKRAWEESGVEQDVLACIQRRRRCGGGCATERGRRGFSAVETEPTARKSMLRPLPLQRYARRRQGGGRFHGRTKRPTH